MEGVGWKVYRVALSDEDREGGGLTDAAIASVLNVGSRTVERVRQQCVMVVLEAAVERREQANRLLHGEAEAKLVALACSKPPAGHARWTIRMLQSKVMELENVDSIGRETVRRTPRKSGEAMT